MNHRDSVFGIRDSGFWALYPRGSGYRVVWFRVQIRLRQRQVTWMEKLRARSKKRAMRRKSIAPTHAFAHTRIVGSSPNLNNSSEKKKNFSSPDGLHFAKRPPEVFPVHLLVFYTQHVGAHHDGAHHDSSQLPELQHLTCNPPKFISGQTLSTSISWIGSNVHTSWQTDMEMRARLGQRREHSRDISSRHRHRLYFAKRPSEG